MIRYFALTLALFVFSGACGAQAEISSPIGEALEAFPGDRFYVEGKTRRETIIRVASGIESKMPGSMRLPFKFAVEATELRRSKVLDGWTYYAAPEGHARAWHGMLGSVLSQGDTVGIRVGQTDREIEWFVDNSYHNGFTTIWKRKVREDELGAIAFEERSTIDQGSALRALQYLGTRDGQLRIRYTESGPTGSQTEEFLFPVEQEMPMTIGVMGLRAEVQQVSGSSMTVKVIRGFEDSGFAGAAQGAEVR